MAETSKGQTSKGQTSKGLAAAGGAGPADAAEAVLPVQGQAIGGLSFEEALAELEAIVQKLERGQLDLESSIQAYERGTALQQHCAGKLQEVRLRVDKLTADREGRPRLVPFEEA